jgi:hypothetical protein
MRKNTPPEPEPHFTQKLLRQQDYQIFFGFWENIFQNSPCSQLPVPFATNSILPTKPPPFFDIPPVSCLPT